MELTIVRSQWLRGDKGDSFLLRDYDQKLCCLGFLGEAMGATRAQMLNVTSPSGLVNDCAAPKHYAELLTETRDYSAGPDSRRSYIENNAIATELMEANDDVDMSEAERERLIVKGMAAIGVSVTFVD